MCKLVAATFDFVPLAPRTPQFSSSLHLSDPWELLGESRHIPPLFLLVQSRHSFQFTLLYHWQRFLQRSQLLIFPGPPRSAVQTRRKFLPSSLLTTFLFGIFRFFARASISAGSLCLCEPLFYCPRTCTCPGLPLPFFQPTSSNIDQFHLASDPFISSFLLCLPPRDGSACLSILQQPSFHFLFFGTLHLFTLGHTLVHC